MKELLICTVAVMLLAGTTAAVLASEKNIARVAHATQAVVTNAAHPSRTLKHQPRIGPISSARSSPRAMFLPSEPAPLPVDSTLGGMLKHLGYSY